MTPFIFPLVTQNNFQKEFSFSQVGCRGGGVHVQKLKTGEEIKKGVVLFRILFVETTFNLLLKSWCTRTGSFGFTLLFACYIDLQWNPTLVARLFKGNPHLRDNTLWSRIFSGFSNVKKPLFKEPLFKGYSDLRDKFLKISLISGEILDKFNRF